MKAKRITINTVNAALEKRGVAERLVKGEGYFYFADGDAHHWPQSGVYGTGARINDMPLEKWLESYDELHEAYIETLEPAVLDRMLIDWFKNEFARRTRALADGKGRIDWIDEGTRVSWSEIVAKAEQLGIKRDAIDLRNWFNEQTGK